VSVEGAESRGQSEPPPEEAYKDDGTGEARDPEPGENLASYGPRYNELMTMDWGSLTQAQRRQFSTPRARDVKRRGNERKRSELKAEE